MKTSSALAAATGRLRDELAKYPFAEGGVVLFCQYRYLAVEYLLISVLSSCHSMRVNEQLDLSTTHYLDINRADIVARIDLTEWENNPESTRYLTFLKGRVGRKVSDFFMDFLSAAEGLDTKAQTGAYYRRLMITVRMLNLAKMSVRHTVSRFIAIVMSSCKQVKRLRCRRFLKSCQSWVKKISSNSRLNRAMHWKRVSRQIAVLCAS